jgi:dynein heavy chain, axonemal
VPKRDALFQAMRQMQVKEKEIEKKRMEVQALQGQLEALRERHTVLRKEVEILQNQIDECSVKKDRAGKLLNGLGGEKQKWLVCNRMIDKRFVTIQGDVLLGAAFITYLSPFSQKFREKACEKWSDIITQQEILI